MPRLLLGTLLAIATAAPAAAASEPTTRLESCGQASCLVVSGQREDVSAEVAINGHAVPVEGSRKWRARLPVATVRAWSAPYARTITVSVAGTSQQADLPIGLLGHADLTMLVVTAR